MRKIKPVDLRAILFVVLTLSFLVSSNSQAYIGPGAGLSAIGTVLAFLAAIVLAIVGFVWYPLKRLRKKMAAKNTMPEDVPSTDGVGVDKVAEEDHSKQ